MKSNGKNDTISPIAKASHSSQPTIASDEMPPTTNVSDKNVPATGASTNADDGTSDVELVHFETRKKRDNHENIIRGLFGRFQQSRQGQTHHQDCSRKRASDTTQQTLEYDEEALSWTCAANNRDTTGVGDEVYCTKDYYHCGSKKYSNESVTNPHFNTNISIVEASTVRPYTGSDLAPIAHASIQTPNDTTYNACKSNPDPNALKNILEDKDEDEDEDERFPKDSYSILALNGPTRHSWPWQKRFSCLFAFVTCLFQFAFLELLLFHLELKHEDVENQYVHMDAACIRNARMAQAAALLTYVMFPTSTLKDLIIAVKLFPMSCKNVAGVPLGCTRISCILRGGQSIFAITVVLLLVMSTENILDIILNFTAVNFITDLDDTAFKLARSGVFGPALKAETKRIENMKLPPCIHRKSTHFWYGSVMLATLVVLFGFFTSMILSKEKCFVWILEALKALKIVGVGFLSIYACFLFLHGIITRTCREN